MLYMTNNDDTDLGFYMWDRYMYPGQRRSLGREKAVTVIVRCESL